MRIKVKVKKEDLDKCEGTFDVIELVCGEYLKSIFKKKL